MCKTIFCSRPLITWLVHFGHAFTYMNWLIIFSKHIILNVNTGDGYQILWDRWWIVTVRMHLISWYDSESKHCALLLSPSEECLVCVNIITIIKLTVTSHLMLSYQLSTLTSTYPDSYPVKILSIVGSSIWIIIFNNWNNLSAFVYLNLYLKFKQE